MDPFLVSSSATSDDGVTQRFIKKEMLKKEMKKSGLMFLSFLFEEEVN